jgi:type 1 glutamine amidotransferase
MKLTLTRWGLMGLLLVFLNAGIGAAATPAGKIQVLVYGGGSVHDFRGINAAVMEILGRCPQLELTAVTDTVLPAPQAKPGEPAPRPVIHSALDAMLAKLPQSDVLFFHHTGGKLTPEQEQALCGAIASGKGFVGVHSAADSFKQNATYMEMIGGSFRTHPAYGPIDVTVHQPEHAIAKGLPERFTIQDEHYILKHDRSKLNVIADAPYKLLEYKMVVEQKDGKEVKTRKATGKIAETGIMPAVWTKTWDKGRVAYISFCHDAKATRQEPVAKLVLQAVLWAGEK